MKTFFTSRPVLSLCPQLANSNSFVDKKPSIEFIHFSDPDDLGHSMGWMSNPQLEAVRHADKCLGTLVNGGYQTIQRNVWNVVFPAGAIAVLMLSFTFIGDGLRDALDPRTRG